MSANLTKLNCDVVIIGGGMVGATMALALSELPVSIAVIEAFEFSHQQQPSFDDRSLALSLGSVQILKAIDLWQELAPRAFPIEKIHVSDKGNFGFARMDAQELQQDALGFVIETREAGKVLYQQLKSKSNITLFCPASYELKQNQHKVVLDVSEYDTYSGWSRDHDRTVQYNHARSVHGSPGGPVRRCRDAYLTATPLPTADRCSAQGPPAAS